MERRRRQRCRMGNKKKKNYRIVVKINKNYTIYFTMAAAATLASLKKTCS